MSINDLGEKIKSKIVPFYTLILLAVVAVIFFWLGRLSAFEEIHEPIRIIQSGNGQTTQAFSTISPGFDPGESVSASSADSGEVVGSKNGTKYYFPWCGTAKTIKPENLVTFASVALARAAGYTPAGNCKGLK